MKFILNNLNLNWNEISCFEAEMDSDQSRDTRGGGGGGGVGGKGYLVFPILSFWLYEREREYREKIQLISMIYGAWLLSFRQAKS